MLDRKPELIKNDTFYYRFECFLKIAINNQDSILGRRNVCIGLWYEEGGIMESR